MKKIFAVIMVLILSLNLCACGVIREEITINFGESHTFENEELAQYENLKWESEEPNIADVKNGQVVGIGPGTTKITVKENEKMVADYTVTVNVNPITNILLSTNEQNLKIGDKFTLNYTLLPENASAYGLKWISADESVAMVNQSGEVTAISEGQTTITLTDKDGHIASCIVAIAPLSPYEQLADREKKLVDVFVKHLGDFHNPYSIKLRKAEEASGGAWYVEITGTSLYGNMATDVYRLSDEDGFMNYRSFGVDQDFPKMLYPDDDTYNIDLMNEAIEDKR